MPSNYANCQSASPHDRLYVFTLQFNLLSYGVISQALFNYCGIKALLNLSLAFVRATHLTNTTESPGYLQGSIPCLFILNNVLICNWCCQKRKGIKRADALKKKSCKLTGLNGTLRTLNPRFPSSGVDTPCQAHVKCGFIMEIRRSPTRSKTTVKWIMTCTFLLSHHLHVQTKLCPEHNSSTYTRRHITAPPVWEPTPQSIYVALQGLTSKMPLGIL